jgi:hypothetical protein
MKRIIIPGEVIHCQENRPATPLNMQVLQNLEDFEQDERARSMHD